MCDAYIELNATCFEGELFLRLKVDVIGDAFGDERFFFTDEIFVIRLLEITNVFISKSSNYFENEYFKNASHTYTYTPTYFLCKYSSVVTGGSSFTSFTCGCTTLSIHLRVHF